MPRRKLYDLGHYSKSGDVFESRKSAEVDKIWGERTPFHGDEKSWDVRVDKVLLECVSFSATCARELTRKLDLRRPEDQVEKWVQSCCVLYVFP